MGERSTFGSANQGYQVGHSHGNVTNHFHHGAERGLSSDTLCLRALQTTNPYDDKTRIEATKGGLLRGSYHWILSNDDYQKWRADEKVNLLWIKGDPGKGKTMLMCGIIDELTQELGHNTNISFFFCEAADERINNATSVLRSLIYMITNKQPSLLSHVRKRYDGMGKRLFEDANAWQALTGILSDILVDQDLHTTYFLVDALDECLTDLPKLLKFISDSSSSGNFPIKWIVSGRDSSTIKDYINDADENIRLSLELNEASVSEAVTFYIHEKVEQLARKKKSYRPETLEEVRHHLLSKAQGTFLWVALAYQELQKAKPWNTLRLLTAFPPGLDPLYTQMLDRIQTSEDSGICIRILTTVFIVYRPIGLNELLTLVDLPSEIHVEFLPELIASCGSFLTLRDGQIFFIHQSAKDFLVQKAPRQLFPMGIAAEHSAILSRSLPVMFSILRRNIYGPQFSPWEDYFFRKPEPDPLDAIKYPCIHWVSHLQDAYLVDGAEVLLRHWELVEIFLREKFLNWIEAISLLKVMERGIEMILQLEDFVQKRKISSPSALSVFDRVQDASRFIRRHKHTIEKIPHQIYISCLIFSPAKSITRLCYQHEIPHGIIEVPFMENDWGPCLFTLNERGQAIFDISWSPDGQKVAIATSCDVQIWNPVTGQCILTLEGHDRKVTRVRWTHDGKRLASAGRDRKINIWNTENGLCIQSLQKLTHPVYDISWSQDDRQLAFAGEGLGINVWDTLTEQYTTIIAKHWKSPDSKVALAFTNDASRLASLSSARSTVEIWKLSTGDRIFRERIFGHLENKPAQMLKWSPDGAKLALVFTPGIIRVWNPSSSYLKLWDIPRVDLSPSHVHSISWSPDGDQLAASLSNSTIKIIDVKSCVCISELPHGPETCLSWASNGRLASGSKSIKIWNVVDSGSPSTRKYPLPIENLSWSPDGVWLMSWYLNKGIWVWEPISKCASISWPVRGARSLSWSCDGSKLAISDTHGGFHIWDRISRDFISLKESTTSQVELIAWSRDGKLASLSRRRRMFKWSPVTINYWDPATGQCISTFQDMSTVDRPWPKEHGEIFQFSEVSPGLLCTDIGNIDLQTGRLSGSASSSAIQHRQLAYSIDESLTWIYHGKNPIIWLPMEFRPSPHGGGSFGGYTICETPGAVRVAIACESGAVITFTLSKDTSFD